MPSPISRFVALLIVSVAATSPVMAQARVNSPIAGAQQQVPYAPLVVRLALQDGAAEVRVEHVVLGSAPKVLCDFRRGTVSPAGDIRVPCADVAAGWSLRVLRRIGTGLSSCPGSVVTPAVKAGVPVVLTVVRDQSRPAGLNLLSCRFEP